MKVYHSKTQYEQYSIGQFSENFELFCTLHVTQSHNEKTIDQLSQRN